MHRSPPCFGDGLPYKNLGGTLKVSSPSLHQGLWSATLSLWAWKWGLQFSCFSPQPIPYSNDECDKNHWYECLEPWFYILYVSVFVHFLSAVCNYFLSCHNNSGISTWLLVSNECNSCKNQCWSGVVFILFYTIQVSIMQISHFLIPIGYGYLTILYSLFLTQELSYLGKKPP